MTLKEIEQEIIKNFHRFKSGEISDKDYELKSAELFAEKRKLSLN